MRQITHQEYQQDYNNAYEVAVVEIKQLGWETVRNNENKKYPAPTKFNTLREYYVANAYVEALLDCK